jgi:hypothetical protein
MPIQRFNSFEEARQALVCEPGTEEHLRRLKALWSRSSRLAPRTFPGGVFKFRSIEEANADRDRQQAEFMIQLKRSRRAADS